MKITRPGPLSELEVPAKLRIFVPADLHSFCPRDVRSAEPFLVTRNRKEGLSNFGLLQREI